MAADPFRSVACAAAAIVLAGCQTPPPPTTPEAVGEVRKGSGFLNGYLEHKQLPDSLGLLPPPPAAGSAQQAADLDTTQRTRALRDTPRWALAAQDAQLKFPAAARTFECALQLPISQQDTPHLNMLLRRTMLDAALATYAAKDHYQRQRPFAATGGPTCTPGEEAALAKDGSYPSGHTAIGWAWALVLTQAAPRNTDALLQRGYAFGWSRVVCGVHWQSDVEAGRTIGAATVARLQSDETFQAQLALARQEIAQAQASGAKPNADCAAEAAALAVRQP
ncbi:MAG TPA: phosphatase PAP2 family protein [Rubrivivax sp.]|nr:phosphatase PAP2 family protein [Rubrivivax sp.]HPO18986.1 phosphatase PAP2 family protein [Rubrivivax sp.]